MGTTSTYFGGSGGGGNIGSSSLGSFYPLDTELPLYMPYKVTNTDGSFLDNWAGNPLGNNYRVKWISATQFRLTDNVGSTIVNIGVSNINASAAYLGGACYLSNGNILIMASSSGATPTFYYSEFEYNTGNKPTGGLDGSFVSGISRTAFDGTSGINYNMLFDGTNYRIQGSQGWWTVNSTFTNIIQEGYNGEGTGTIIGSNGIAIGVRAPTTATNQAAQVRVRRHDRSADIPSQTGTPFSATANIHNLSAGYSAVFGIHADTATRPRYIGYPDGKVWSDGAGPLFKLTEYDALCAEFQTKYVDVWEA